MGRAIDVRNTSSAEDVSTKIETSIDSSEGAPYF